ncbi:MAG TPA: radical SAM/Cys-rich domain protein [Gammaproteobacteria bacterium]|nr:radical SAM/Cys-rich domain protein [Gammaproteobacteria bacterium]
MHAMRPLLEQSDFPAVQRGRLETLQVNLGYRCNQSCLHCHVNAGPHRREQMSGDTVDAVLDLAARAGVSRLDLTGGAPELNPHFRRLVECARALGLHVIDRCNLTVLAEPGQEDLAEFLARQRVEVVASLPCYLPENVEAQRGKGVHAASIAGLKRLNALGYGQAQGRGGSALVLNLMYNPGGPFLPPPQAVLEADYRRELAARHGVLFDRLFTLTNMPIMRFGSSLVSRGEFDAYMGLLREAFCPDNLDTVMCRSLVSVDWRGYLYDCDFNQMLDMPLCGDDGRPLHVAELDPAWLEGRDITVADHCYGCTAGQGSSCGGALAG